MTRSLGLGRGSGRPAVGGQAGCQPERPPRLRNPGTGRLGSGRQLAEPSAIAPPFAGRADGLSLPIWKTGGIVTLLVQ